MATQQFDPIFHGLSSEVGKFRIAASGMAWKGVNSEEVTALKATDIKWAQWLRVARNFQLRVGLQNHQKETFDGFQREDHDQLATLLKNHFAITLETVEVSFKGWNWGVTDFRGRDLAFQISDRIAFELPLENVTNANIAGKTEVSLEFANPSSSKLIGDEVTEIRFYVPGNHSKLKGSDAGSNKSDAEDNEDDEEVSAAQVFHEQVKERSGTGEMAGKLILSFEDIFVLTPRGRYDMDMAPEFLRLRGKTYDYKILYSSISRLFLLPQDDIHVLFILGLNIPIRQGQTRYQYLVMQFTREEEITAELNMTDEDIAKYDRLKKNYEEPTFEVVSSVFRALSRKKIIGSGSFQSREGLPGMKANLKAVHGDLFFLEKYIFFVSKQPTLIELSDIQSITFSRISATSRTFDMKVVTKSGPEYSFTTINKEEHEPCESFLKEKKLKVKNETVPDAELLMAAAVGDDDDEEMASVSSDDDQGRSRVSRHKDDDESEEDEDFEASSSDEGSPSESDSSDGGAATASDASGDKEVKQAKKLKKKKKSGDANKASKAADSDADDGAEPKKKAPKPKSKKKKSDDAMDVDGDSAKSKPKPKPKPKPKGDDKMDIDEAKSGDEDEEPPRKKAKTSSP